MNVLRRHGHVATDTVCTDHPAIGAGQTAAQALIGRKTHVIDIFGVRTDAEFVNTLLDVIRKRGAMDHLISDLAAAGLSTRIKDALRALVIGEWQSEAYLHHQNFAERKYQDIKAKANLILNRSQDGPWHSRSEMESRRPSHDNDSARAFAARTHAHRVGDGHGSQRRKSRPPERTRCLCRNDDRRRPIVLPR